MHNEGMTDDSFKTHYQMNESNEKETLQTKSSRLNNNQRKGNSFAGIILDYYLVFCVAWQGQANNSNMCDLVNH